MYLHLVYAPELFAVASRRKWTRMFFHQATELMVAIDHEYAGESTTPTFAFHSYPFHMVISLPLGKRLTSVLWDTYGCEKPMFLSIAHATFVHL